MSNLLWRYYLEDNVDKFRNLLANGYPSSQYIPKSHGGGTGQTGSLGAIVGSPVTSFGTSPRTTAKNRKSSGHHAGILSGAKGHTTFLSRSDLNSRDQSGLTVLHRAASSTADNAISFALALIDNPAVDLYIQDLESGWTALHRALYFGNVTVARALMERDAKDSVGQGASNTVIRANGLMKIKDHEGNSAFDVYYATIARRTLQRRNHSETVQGSEDGDDDSVGAGSGEDKPLIQDSIDADELFAFGSNKNLTLGFGDEDDRQHPEKVISKAVAGDASVNLSHAAVGSVADLPALIRNRPIVIQDVALSKLHSAILTTDPESNLYICGFGPGGRLGMGDETTRFNYVCVEGGGLAGKKIVAVALGQNHCLAVSSQGEVFTWGTNTWGQLGYTLPRPVLQDEEPINSTPRQIFGPLKREIVLGVAASTIHSVAFTSTSLYTWGKNEGQLGLMDSDSRSLEAQTVPRRVASSLFASSIRMVSAINRATICLLANHTVYVFTNYGYNNVKFPTYNGFTNYHLKSTALATRYESELSHISSITSGGDTIAAISSRGDLFTVNVSQKLDSNPTATSTTNPAKIRNALSQPQRVWSLRKGNWDGIKSVGVGENGSIIICTQAGAVWRRVRRAKIKNAYMSGTGEAKSKDYKFERVPGLTKVVAVRCNMFGAYAALRKDCDVTRTQIIVNQPDLWKDLAPLFSLRDLEASEPGDDKEGVSRFLMPALSKKHFDPFKRAVLASPDLEADISHHVRNTVVGNGEHDVEVSTSLSETSIPVHGFMLAARSPILREALCIYRRDGTYTHSELLTITGSTNPKIVLQGLDFLTVLNLVLYVYDDTVVDVWHFARHAPKSAFRYRQVRTELMKVAVKLGMGKLESAVRLMSVPEPRLNLDLALAFEDPRFFEDGDAIIQLHGGDMVVHSSLVRQRCPFFEGLFNGRAAGQWLAGRREAESEAIKIDMKHIIPSTFELVLRYLYTDVGTELFDGIISADIDEFCDVVMDVMSVANELMLNRLSQICQQVIGQFVNTRNICQLLNVVAPYSVTDFKNAGLEYLCLQLEAILETHLLDELDEGLLLELDEVVRGNQLACLPFAKSGRAELLLHERHPDLAGEIDEERQRKVRDISFRSTLRDDDNRLSSFRARVGSVGDIISSSPSQDKFRRKSKAPQNGPFSPAVRPKDSTTDLMFDMDAEDSTILGNPASPNQNPIDETLDLTSEPITPKASKDMFSDLTGKEILTDERSSLSSPNLASMVPATFSSLMTEEIPKDDGSSAVTNRSWSSTAFPSSKLDMREIMAQASRGRTSSLSMSLSAENTKVGAAAKVSASKMSQKERKKQQQALQQVISEPGYSLDKAHSSTKPSTPWQVPIAGPKMSLKDVLDTEAESPSPTQSSKPSMTPILTLTLNHRRTASPDTRFSGQKRSVSSTAVSKTGQTSSPNAGPSRPSPQTQGSKSINLIPHSKSYTNPVGKAEPSLQLSMADIIGQQRREQEVIKEAVAKRSLQEIQEEQAFQEWWDQESRKAQEQEVLRLKGGLSTGGESGSLRGKEGKRGRGGRPRGRGDAAQGRERGRGRGRGSGRGNGPGQGQGQGAMAG